VAHQHKIAQLKGINETSDIDEMILGGIGGILGPLAIAVPPLIQGQDVIAIPKGGGEEVPGMSQGGEAV